MVRSDPHYGDGGSRRKGVILVDVVEEFGIYQRAQRMVRGLEMAFPGVVCSTDRKRRRWWKLSDTTHLCMQDIRGSELAALAMAPGAPSTMGRLTT